MLLKNTAFILAFSLAALPSAGAQTVTGSMVGRVADASDAVIVGAKVLATEITRNVARETTTNDQGIYTIASLEPGVYRVEVEKEGFKKFINERVEVNINTTVRVDAAMQVGGVGGTAGAGTNATEHPSSLDRAIGDHQNSKTEPAARTGTRRSADQLSFQSRTGGKSRMPDIRLPICPNMQRIDLSSNFEPAETSR